MITRPPGVRNRCPVARAEETLGQRGFASRFDRWIPRAHDPRGAMPQSVVDGCKNEPRLETMQKNDVAFLKAFVYKLC